MTHAVSYGSSGKAEVLISLTSVFLTDVPIGEHLFWPMFTVIILPTKRLAQVVETVKMVVNAQCTVVGLAAIDLDPVCSIFIHKSQLLGAYSNGKCCENEPQICASVPM